MYWSQLCLLGQFLFTKYFRNALFGDVRLFAACLISWTPSLSQAQVSFSLSCSQGTLHVAIGLISRSRYLRCLSLSACVISVPCWPALAHSCIPLPFDDWLLLHRPNLWLGGSDNIHIIMGRSVHTVTGYPLIRLCQSLVTSQESFLKSTVIWKRGNGFVSES